MLIPRETVTLLSEGSASWPQLRQQQRNVTKATLSNLSVHPSAAWTLCQSTQGMSYVTHGAGGHFA